MKADKIDRTKVLAELSKHSHPLDKHCEALYNIVTGQVAPDGVNVIKAAAIGEQMAATFKKGLPQSFYKPISTPIKTMALLKKVGKNKESSIALDLESYFLRILTVSQQRDVDLKELFKFEMCSIPPSLIDEYGCLRKGQKAPIVKHLGRNETSQSLPDTVIVDGQQLVYHVHWPCGGNASVLAASMNSRLDRYSSKVVLVFDKYKDSSAKDHERTRRGGADSAKFNLEMNTLLPKRDIIMKNNHNKVQLTRILSTFSMGSNVQIENKFDEQFGHDEADITMISYVLDAYDKGAAIIRVLSDDTDVFVLLVYWCYKRQMKAMVQMEKWDGTILFINETCCIESVDEE